MTTVITKTFRLPAELLTALESWRDATAAAEGARPPLQTAVIRLLWQALRRGVDMTDAKKYGDPARVARDWEHAWVGEAEAGDYRRLAGATYAELRREWQFFDDDASRPDEWMREFVAELQAIARDVVRARHG